MTDTSEHATLSSDHLGRVPPQAGAAPCDFGCSGLSPGLEIAVTSEYALPDATLALLAQLVVAAAKGAKTEAA